jgi:xanthine dehydrogenase molybdopterin-binding subunit B
LPASPATASFYKTPKLHWDREKGRGRPFFYYAYGAACSEGVIDILSGEMKVRRVDILHDVGRSINPAIDIGQIEGAFVQGMGWLTTEELVYDEKGDCGGARRAGGRARVYFVEPLTDSFTLQEIAVKASTPLVMIAVGATSSISGTSAPRGALTRRML